MKTNYKHRIILISDMHYSTEETAKELQLIYPNAKASPAAGKAFGYTQKEKIDYISSDIAEFMKDKTVDAVLVLGDLSIDDYSFRNLPENYCKKFKEHCMEKFPCSSYAIPGNHDSYPNDIWRNMFGYDRQYSVKIQDAAFIMLDTFASTPATGASGSPYTGINYAFLEKELKKYPNEQIFICAHWLTPQDYTDEFIELLNKNDRIVCLFDAHTHVSKIHVPDKRIRQYQVNVGGYGYEGEKRADNKWYFDRFDEAWAWGYEVLEWNETEAHMYYIKPARKYTDYNGVIIDYAGAVENELVIPLF